MKQLFQQGDVLNFKVEQIPNHAQKIGPEKRGYVLAEGEATGHYHAIKESNKAEMYELDGELFLKVLEEAPLTHQEHDTIFLPVGNYEVKRVREYDHFAEEARYVAD